MQESHDSEAPSNSRRRKDKVKMDVFISWSGTQSKQVAEALRHYLPLMINAIQPYLSSADIEAGARWASDVAGKLQQSKVGIICLTPTNLQSIWIHFEAGALAKTLDNTFVCPYLVGVEPSDVKGPLTQFQAKRANEEDTKRLLDTLNSALGENAVKAEQLAEAFSLCWPKLKAQLDALQKDELPAEKRPERDMLEELLELARRQARRATEETGFRLTGPAIPGQLAISIRNALGPEARLIDCGFTLSPTGIPELTLIEVKLKDGTVWTIPSRRTPRSLDDWKDLETYLRRKAEGFPGSEPLPTT
jgi:hypothetical protein